MINVNLHSYLKKVLEEYGFTVENLVEIVNNLK